MDCPAGAEHAKLVGIGHADAASEAQMPEPITLAVVSGLVLTEGIKFLYGQANDLLKGWRARRDAKKQAAVKVPPMPTLDAPPPDVLDGSVDTSQQADELLLEKHERELDAAKKALAKYTHPDDPEPVDPGDVELRGEVDRLRRLLESIYGQRLTFVGEPDRDPTGTVMTVKVKADNIEDSDIAAIVGADRAPAGARLGVDVDASGAKRSSVRGIDFGPMAPRTPRTPRPEEPAL